uniref:Aspartate racemase (EC) n=1 Tax=uncultured Thiotrichaceae bacterium TaxID=298394 RepID=A0A6S6SSE5_9GAMM|nr:MAG: Aspartate racemase (EC [uncultured Thiotrichaceae bacterium]
MHKTVGVIGGMGPDATVELMQRVIAATPAEDDADHIHMLVDNNPKIPSRLKALLDGGGENPGPVIAQMAQQLEQAGVDFLVIPCNTAHYYHRYAQEAVDIPVWHLIQLSLQNIKAHYPVKRVGLLASSAVQKIELFEPFFAEADLELVYPGADTQVVIMQVIRAVKAGALTDELLSEYNRCVAGMDGVDAYLLGCSELSVLLNRHQQELPVVDALQVLADGIVAECVG